MRFYIGWAKRKKQQNLLTINEIQAELWDKNKINFSQEEYETKTLK